MVTFPGLTPDAPEAGVEERNTGEATCAISCSTAVEHETIANSVTNNKNIYKPYSYLFLFNIY